ncbi:hypothetical protein LZP69_00770 [Shewanella sp. AS1]|uniref:hypothetical protein n=1 Tax=Shewanella sp. AS1 TaxID=2907626 RepID=UPI001F1B1E7C|nr:hypothetical protein [Shewanella sp. AS1]MCE9677722.1 hypothetical protein [Shewanella sp. AS1]
MKTSRTWLDWENVIAVLALLLLVVATQSFTHDASSWFLFGLHIIDATESYRINFDAPQLPDVVSIGADLTLWLLEPLLK